MSEFVANCETRKRASVAALRQITLCRLNVEKWFDNGLGLADISAKTGHDRDYIKDCAKQWGLWK